MEKASDKPDLESAEPLMSTGLAVDCAELQGEAMAIISCIQIDEMPCSVKKVEVELMLITVLWDCVCKYPLFHSEAREAQ